MADGKVENTNIGKVVVSNPLLSGAGVTFPYEHFQGTSLLVPVPQQPEPLLIQDESEVDTFVGQEPLVEPQPTPAPPQPERPQSTSQGYTGLFSSFFGAIAPQEAPPSEKTVEQASVTSTPRSYSPFVHVPNVTSYSPALFVPEEKSEVTATVSSAPAAVLPPPPSAQFVPLTGNLYRQQPRQAKPPPALTPQRHFIPVSEPVAQRPATADSLHVDTLSEDNAGSTSSSNDSIVADLQSRFAATNLSNPPLPVPVSGQPEPFSTQVYAQNFENSSDLIKTDHSFLEASGRDFHESFGAVGQPVLHPGIENRESQALTQTTHFSGDSGIILDDHARQGYGVPWQGFGQVSANTEDTFKRETCLQEPENTPVQEEKSESHGNEKTFYDQHTLTEESLENTRAENKFYSQPNSIADLRDPPSTEARSVETDKNLQSAIGPQQPVGAVSQTAQVPAPAFKEPSPEFSGVPLTPSSQPVLSSGSGRFRRGGLSRRPVYAQVPGLSSGAPQENFFAPQPSATPGQVFNPTLFPGDNHPVVSSPAPFNPYATPLQNPTLTETAPPDPSSGAPQENFFTPQPLTTPRQVFNPTLFPGDNHPVVSSPAPFNPYATPIQNPTQTEAAPLAVPLEISKPPTSVFGTSSQQPAATLPYNPLIPASQPPAPAASAPPPLFGEESQKTTSIFPTQTLPPSVVQTSPSSFFEQPPLKQIQSTYSFSQPAPGNQPPPPALTEVPPVQSPVISTPSTFSPVPLASSPPIPFSDLPGPPQLLTQIDQTSEPHPPAIENQPSVPESAVPKASILNPSSFFQPASSPPASFPPADLFAQASNPAAFFNQPQSQFFQPEPVSTPSSVSSFGAPPQASSPPQLTGIPFGQETNQTVFSRAFSPPSTSSTPSVTDFFNSPSQPPQNIFSQSIQPNSYFPQQNPEQLNPFPKPKPFEPPLLPQQPANPLFAPSIPEPSSFLGTSTASNFFSDPTVPQTSTFFDPAPQSTMASPPPDQDLLNTVDLSTPPRPARTPSPSVVPQRLLNLGQSGIIYRPPYFHWFWNTDSNNKEAWKPFSMTDSMELEQAFNSGNVTMDTIVPTDGGRYDVAVVARRRDAVFWNELPKDVRRCSWFHRKSTESKPSPYDENTAYTLEEAYKAAVQSATWHRRVELPDGEHVVMYGPTSIAHFIPSMPAPDSWEAATEGGQGVKRMWVVKRGVDEFEIDDGESPVVDHVLFVVHGIGSACDLKFRTIEEAVNDFRQTSHQLVRTHYRTSMEQGEANRVEILPVSWHESLHEETGVDEKIKKITLKSIPKLRNFTNDTLLDILFYTSPVYCQKIIDQVGHELNRLFALFKRRNPTFQGSVSVAGHSLGSLILFDMLCHQKRSSQKPDASGEGDNERRLLTRTGSYMTGTAGTGQPYITYPQLDFHPNSFFAMGSPIGMFVTVRGIDSLGIDFKLPTCPGLFNIFHPFDPVAYRLEALINPDLATQRPVLIPHHKGRKRMHLELRETMARVGADLKQRVFDTVRTTWNAVYQLTSFGRSEEAIRQEVDEAIATSLTPRLRTESSCEDEIEAIIGAANGLNVGVANQGRRVDYVLQEAPLESFNEYVSAITSHVCYWDSEDTVLFILKDIYTNMGVAADSPASIAEAAAAEDPIDPSGPPSPPSPSGFVDPTAPLGTGNPVQPPPIAGFFRK